jgi:GNAT superfamily N-acetyltransferase
VAAPVLRPGRTDEAAEMLEVMAEALAGEAASGAIAHAFPDPQGEAAWLRYLLSTGAGWVAESDGRLAGFGITALRGRIDWLVSLFVRPEAQGSGLGRRLLEQLWPPAPTGDRATLVDAASRPATSLYLHAGLTPRFPVLAFEGRLGSRLGGAPAARDDEDETRPQVAELDSAAFGSHRPDDHAFWTENGFAFRSLYDRDGVWLGYGRWNPGVEGRCRLAWCAGRAGGRSRQVGRRAPAAARPGHQHRCPRGLPADGAALPGIGDRHGDLRAGWLEPLPDPPGRPPLEVNR